MKNMRGYLYAFFVGLLLVASPVFAQQPPAGGTPPPENTGGTVAQPQPTNTTTPPPTGTQPPTGTTTPPPADQNMQHQPSTGGTFFCNSLKRIATGPECDAADATAKSTTNTTQTNTTNTNTMPQCSTTEHMEMDSTCKQVCKQNTSTTQTDMSNLPACGTEGQKFVNGAPSCKMEMMDKNSTGTMFCPKLNKQTTPEECRKVMDTSRTEDGQDPSLRSEDTHRDGREQGESKINKNTKRSEDTQWDNSGKESEGHMMGQPNFKGRPGRFEFRPPSREDKEAEREIQNTTNSKFKSYVNDSILSEVQGQVGQIKSGANMLESALKEFKKTSKKFADLLPEELLAIPKNMREKARKIEAIKTVDEVTEDLAGGMFQGPESMEIWGSNMGEITQIFNAITASEAMIVNMKTDIKNLENKAKNLENKAKNLEKKAKKQKSKIAEGLFDQAEGLFDKAEELREQAQEYKDALAGSKATDEDEEVQGLPAILDGVKKSIKEMTHEDNPSTLYEAWKSSFCGALPIDKKCPVILEGKDIHIDTGVNRPMMDSEGNFQDSRPISRARSGGKKLAQL